MPFPNPDFDALKWLDELKNLGLDDGIISGAEQLLDQLSLTRRNLRKYELLAEITDLGFWELNLKSKEAWRNSQWFRMLGLTKDQASKNPFLWFELVHPVDKSRLSDQVHKLIEGDIDYFEAEYRLKKSDGSYMWVFDKGRIVEKGDHGRALIIAGVHANVDNIKQNQETVTRLFEILEATPDFVSYTDKIGRITYLNPSFANFLGFPAFGHGLHALRIYTENFMHRLREEIIPQVIEQGSWTGEAQIINEKGDVLDVSQTIICHKDQNAEVKYFTTVMRDISPIKDAFKALMESENRFRKLTETAQAIILLHDGKKLVYVNNAFGDLLGYTPSEALKLDMWAVIHPDDLEVVKTRALKRFKGKHSLKRYEYRVLHKDGTYRWIDFAGNLFESNGQKFVLGIAFDITEKKQVEKQLEESEERYRSFLQSLPEIVIESDLNGKIFFANKAAHETFGISEEELKSEFDIFPFIHPDYHNKVIKDLENLLNYGINKTEDYILIKKDGTTFPVLCSSRIVYSEGKPKGFRTIIVDVTVQKTVEKLLEGANRAGNILLTEPDSEKAIQTFLATVGQSFGADRCYVFKNILNDKGQMCMGLTYEWVVDPALSVMDMEELQAIPYSDAGLIDVLLKLQQGEPYYGRVKDLSDTARAILEIQDIKSILVCPILSDNRLWGMIGLDDCKKEREWQAYEVNMLMSLSSSLGATIQKTALMEELRKAKEHAEKAYQEKTNFLSIMSHEIRTPMNSVIGMSEILLQENPRPDQEDNMRILQFSANNLLALLNNILDYNKIEAGKLQLQFEPFNLAELCQSILKVFLPAANKNQTELILEFDASIQGEFKCDKVRLGQIFTNLLSNAVKFTNNGQIIFQVKKVADSGSKEVIRFAVKDTGIGIPEDKISQIFEFFYQIDKREFGYKEGSGLGLAITKNLVELFGSNLMVTTELNKGTEFFFELTLSKLESKFRPTNLSSDAEILQKGESLVGGRKVLVVEDNRVNQIVASKFLKNWGVEAFIANNGQEALSFLEQNSVDLVLMDLQMPVMDGFAATKFIRNHPDPVLRQIPIIALTAATLGDEEELALRAGINLFITKPFNPNHLLAALAQLLNPEAIETFQLSREKKLFSENQPFILHPSLKQFEEMSEGSTDFMMEILDGLISQFEIAIQEYEVALFSNDEDAIRKVKHRIYPTILQLDILLINELMEEGKGIARHLENSRHHTHMVKVETAFNQLINFLKTKRSQLKHG
jgi:PAS domain S-box-containing protein